MSRFVYHANNYQIKQIFIIYMLIFPAISFANSTLEKKESFLTIDAIMAGWDATYRGLTRKQVSTVYKINFQKEALQAKSTPSPNLSIWHEDRIDDGDRYIAKSGKTVGSQDMTVLPDTYSRFAFDGKITREHFMPDKTGMVVSGKLGRSIESGKLDEFLFTEIQNDGQTLFHMLFSKYYKQHKVHPHLEKVAGEFCHVIELVNPDSKDKAFLWIAHDKSMLVMKYEVYKGKDLVHQKKIEQMDFVNFGEQKIWYPIKASKFGKISGYGSGEYELIVKKFNPDPKIDENTFKFKFPDGTKVYDKIIDMTYVVGDTKQFDEKELPDLFKNDTKTKTIQENTKSIAKPIKTIKKKENAATVHSNASDMPKESKISNAKADIDTGSNKLHKVFYLITAIVIGIFCILGIAYKKRQQV